MYYFIRKCQHSDTVLRLVVESNAKDKVDTEDKLDAKLAIAENYANNIEEYNSPNSDENDGNIEEDADYTIKIKTKRKAPTKNNRKRRRNIQMKHHSRIRGPPFKCKNCNETYDTYENLQIHRKEAKHSEARNHACEVCSKTFTSSKLRQHMRAHTKEKPYQCKVCFQGFSMSGNLKRHMMTHTGERPHVCEVCGKGNLLEILITFHYSYYWVLIYFRFHSSNYLTEP